MTRRNSILIEEAERSESPSVRSSAKKLNSSTLTAENVAQLPQSLPARRTRRVTSISESEQREGTPTAVRRSARRNSVTSDDGSIVSNASALRVTRANRKSVHVAEDVLLEADETEDFEIPSTPQLNSKSRKNSCKSPSLSPQISTIVTRSASRSPLPISPEKSLAEIRNESLIKTVLNKSIECIVSLDDVVKVKSPVKIIVEESVQTPTRKTPIKQTPTKNNTPKNKSLIEEIKSPKFATPKTKTPIKEITKIEKTPEKQKTPVASRSVCFDKSASENSGIKYAATPRSQKSGSKINESIYEILDSSKENSVDVSQNKSSINTKDLNQTDLIITDIVNTVTSNITNASMSESILPLVNLEKVGENTPLKNKRLDSFNSSTPMVEKSNYLEKTPLQPILKKNVSLSSSKKTKSEEKKEKKTDFSKSWSQSVVNKIEVTKSIDGFAMEKEDDVIQSKSPKKNQFDSEYSDNEFQYSDDEPVEAEEEEKEKNSFIEDEAMENNEDSMDPEERQYMKDNEISDAGESIGSHDTDAEEEEEEDDKNSFIATDEETELLDGSGDDLSHSPNKLNGSAKKIRKRIIENSSSEDEVEAVATSPKKTPSKLNISQKEKTIKESPVVEEEEVIKEISSDEETKKIHENFNSFLKELNSSHKTTSDDDQDDDFVASEEESEEDLEEGENSDVIHAEEEEAYRDTFLKKFAGTKVNQLNETSVKEITPEVSLLNTTFSKTDDEDEEEEVNVDEKENVEIEEDKNTLNVSQKLLSKTRKSMTPLRKSLNVVQASPALNKSNKNLFNASTASASGGFTEENLNTEAVKTPLKLKRDVVGDTKQVTLSDVKKRCEAILHAKEATKKLLREQYKVIFSFCFIFFIFLFEFGMLSRHWIFW